MSSSTTSLAMYLPGEKSLAAIYVLNILAKMTYAPAVPLLWTMLASGLCKREATQVPASTPASRQRTIISACL